MTREAAHAELLAALAAAQLEYTVHQESFIRVKVKGLHSSWSVTLEITMWGGTLKSRVRGGHAEVAASVHGQGTYKGVTYVVKKAGWTERVIARVRLLAGGADRLVGGDDER